MLLRNKSPDIGYPENEGIWWQGTFGPEYEKGQTLIVDESNIERFVRFRDIGTDFSNEGRMERQKVFLEA